MIECLSEETQNLNFFDYYSYAEKPDDQNLINNSCYAKF